MPGFPLLDVAIGLISVYLLLSLVCSALSEGLESILRHRAHDLETGIRMLLNDPKDWGAPLAWLRRYFPGYKPWEEGATKLFYEHPLVRSLYRSASQLPTYIPVRTFYLAAIDLYNSDQLPEGAKEAIEKLIRAAQGDAEKVRDYVETWFNSTMDRVSGWYKRRTQHVLFVIATLATLTLNADSVLMYKRLQESKNLETVVAMAASLAKTSPAQPDTNDRKKKLEDALTDLRNLDVLPGWQNGDFGWKAICLHFPGWLITIGALTLGAPFWFDTLNRFMVVRATVKPKEKSPEEAPKG